MDRIHIRDFGRTDHRWNVEVALAQPRRPDAYGFVRKAHVQRVTVRLAVNGHRLDAQFLARANHAQGDLTAVRYQDLLEHEFVVSNFTASRIERARLSQAADNCEF